MSSRIPDPKTATKERGENNYLSTFFCCHKYHKIKKKFELVKRKIWANIRIIELFIQNTVIKYSKILVWDSGSEILNPEKTYSGSRIRGKKRQTLIELTCVLVEAGLVSWALAQVKYTS